MFFEYRFLVQANLNDLFAVPSSSWSHYRIFLVDQIEIGALARASECDHTSEKTFLIN